MAVKKKLSQEQALAAQRELNAELVRLKVYEWKDGRLVPNPLMGFDEANMLIETAKRNVTEKKCSKQR